MQGATHFIELYRYKKCPEVDFMKSDIFHIRHLSPTLQRTKASFHLETAFVWKIKEVPSVVIAKHDSQVNAIIIES